MGGCGVSTVLGVLESRCRFCMIWFLPTCKAHRLLVQRLREITAKGDSADSRPSWSKP